MLSGQFNTRFDTLTKYRWVLLFFVLLISFYFFQCFSLLRQPTHNVQIIFDRPHYDYHTLKLINSNKTWSVCRFRFVSFFLSLSFALPLFFRFFEPQKLCECVKKLIVSSLVVLVFHCLSFDMNRKGAVS